MSTKWQKTQIAISKRYTPIERIAIAQDVIDYIVDRTKAGKGPGNKNWSGKAGQYSDAYKKSLPFRASGKSSAVNLKLSGDMLSALTILNETSGKVVVGFENGTTENGKADGNIRGTYGTSKENSAKARPFLDLTNAELKKILANYPVTNRAESIAQAQGVVEAGDIAQEFIDGE